jgi:hypothetical protein
VQPPLLRANALATGRAPLAQPAPKPAMFQPPPLRAAPMPAAPEPELAPAPEAMAPPPAAARAIIIEENPVHVPRGVPEHLRKPNKPQAEAAAPRRSIFSIVTGAIRGAQSTVVEAAPAPASTARVEPSLHEPVETQRVNVRPTSGEDMLDIPAFLRRQTS